MALKNNTWKLNQWYDQSVAGNAIYSGVNELFTWGKNSYGQQAQNDRTTRSSPIQIPGTTWNYLSASSGGSSYGTKTDGTLWFWGANESGEGGKNNLTDYSSPVQIPGTTWETVTSYGESGRSALATKTDGTLWSWGYNFQGQLGLNLQGTPGNRSSPTQVGSDTTWSRAYASTWTLAKKTDGTLWGMGENSKGTLGQNDTADRSSPIQIGSETTWSSVDVGRAHCLGVKTDGTLWAWGAGSVGDLGQNQPQNTHYSSPVQVGSGTDWSDVACGLYRSHGLKTDGTLWSWGYNAEGQLGQNNLTQRSSPVQIPGTSWRRVEAFKNTAQATRTDGTLWTWGTRDDGLLGQNTFIKYSSPIQIGSGTGWDLEKTHNTDNEYVLVKFVK